MDLLIACMHDSNLTDLLNDLVNDLIKYLIK